MVNTRGETGEAYRAQLTQGLAGQSQSLEHILCPVEAISIGEWCERITLRIVLLVDFSGAQRAADELI